MFAGLSGGMAYFNYDFMGPTLALAMENVGLDQVQIGYFFLIYAFSYCVSGLLTPYIKFCSYRNLMIGAIFAESVCMLLIGPSGLIGLSPNVWTMAAGQFLGGLVLPAFLIPPIPEMIGVTDHYFSNESELEKA